MTDKQPNPSSADLPSRNPAMDETIAPENIDTASDGDFSADGIPDSLGRYSIKKLLGRGGMGAVYLAHDSQLDRDVALKVPKFDANANPKSIARFYREARSAANLSHPNLCQVFDVGEIDGTHYIAMAFIKGRPLSDYVDEGKPPNPRVAAGIVRKVAAGMHEAHQSGIIHRDIKPANIMIDHRNEPIVMDFGLAVAQESGTESRLTQDGALLGSPAYMAPEQLRGELDSIGPASDVYALGVVLYELLSGRLPFDGSGSTIAMIGQILTKDPVELLTIRQDLDSEIVAICEKAMSKDVAERYASMKEFAGALTGYLKGKKEPAQTATTPPSGQATKTVTVAQIQINEKAKLAKTLCDTKQFVAAVPILQQIIESPDSNGSKALEYAQAMLPKVQQQVAKETAAKSAPAVTAPVDDPFADLPNTPVGSVPAYKPPPARKKKRGKSRGPNKGLLAGLGAVAIAGCVALAIAYWPPGGSSNPTLSTTPAVANPTPDPVPNSAEQTKTPPPPPNEERRRPNTRPEDGFRDRADRAGERFQRGGPGRGGGPGGQGPNDPNFNDPNFSGQVPAGPGGQDPDDLAPGGPSRGGPGRGQGRGGRGPGGEGQAPGDQDLGRPGGQGPGGRGPGGRGPGGGQGSADQGPGGPGGQGRGGRGGGPGGQGPGGPDDQGPGGSRGQQ